MGAQLSVAVLIDLVRDRSSGGQVKFWERLAEAAAARPPEDLDLTLYTLGLEPRVESLSQHVRFVSLRPTISSRPVTDLVGGVDASDLAPFHPALARRLPHHHVWHLTHTMAFTATALRMPARRRRPMVASLHTDVPFLTECYTQQVLDTLPRPLRGVLHRSGLARLPTSRAVAKQDLLLRSVDRVLVSSEADLAAVSSRGRPEPVSILRHGVDLRLFRPGTPSDRQWVSARCHVDEQTERVCFAGRLDATKGVFAVAEAVRLLRARGRPVHLVLAGEGAAVPEVRRLLGEGVTHLGKLPQHELVRVFGGCTLFAFPSRSETAGDVVGEAMAAGLPPLLPRGARTCRWLAGGDGVVVDGDTAQQWADVIAALLDDPRRRAALGRRARETMENVHPSWPTVLEEDLVPVWRSCVDRQDHPTVSGPSSSS